jgi:hypothetical protein
MTMSISDFNRTQLLNRETISKYILKEAAWADSHGADPEEGFIGAGLLYYTIAYMLRAKLCVCIGSGGGFVPRLMRQAQRDLALADSRTVLIDANEGEWSRPVWMDQHSFFRQQYDDIDIIVSRSIDVLNKKKIKEKWRIDYLHIDGDHSHAGSLNDFKNYAEVMSPRGIITFHDTKPYEYFNVTCWKAINELRDNGHAVIDFPWLGSGTAIIQLNTGCLKPKRSSMLSRQYIFNFFSTIKRRLNGKIASLFHKKPQR